MADESLLNTIEGAMSGENFAKAPSPLCPLLFSPQRAKGGGRGWLIGTLPQSLRGSFATPLVLSLSVRPALKSLKTTLIMAAGGRGPAHGAGRP